MINSGPVTRGPDPAGGSLQDRQRSTRKCRSRCRSAPARRTSRGTSYFKHYKNAKELSYALAPIFNAEMKELVAAGAKYLQIRRSRRVAAALHRRQERLHLDQGRRRAVLRRREREDRLALLLRQCVGQRLLSGAFPEGYQTVLPHFFDTPGINEFVLDYANRNMAGIEFLKNLPKDKSVQVGVLDVRSNAIESPQTIAARIKKVIAAVPPDQRGAQHRLRHEAAGAHGGEDEAQIARRGRGAGAEGSRWRVSAHASDCFHTQISMLWNQRGFHMLKATAGIMLPTTITGSLPRPSWYTENLGTRSFLDAMVTSRFREQYVDALSVYLREQEVAGLDIVTDGDCRFDQDIGGQSWTSYPPHHMSGFDTTHPKLATVGAGGIAFPRGHILHDYLEARVMPKLVGPVGRGEMQYAEMFKAAQRMTAKPVKFGTVTPELVAFAVQDEHYKDIPDRGSWR